MANITRQMGTECKISSMMPMSGMVVRGVRFLLRFPDFSDRKVSALRALMERDWQVTACCLFFLI